MKQYLKPAYLPFAILGCGVIALLMRLWLFALGEDDRGLLSAGNFPDVMCWIMTAVTMALLAVGLWNIREASKYSFNFPASTPAALGICLAAVAFLVDSIVKLVAGTDTIGTLCALLGLVSAGALGFIAYCRAKGIRPVMIFHGIVCLYLMLLLVNNYRIWSAYPQLQRYAFELLAEVFLMLSSYQRAAFDCGQGQRKAYAFFSLAALFFCLAAIPGSGNAGFYIGCAFWMFTTPCNMTALPSFKKED